MSQPSTVSAFLISDNLVSYLSMGSRAIQSVHGRTKEAILSGLKMEATKRPSPSAKHDDSSLSRRPIRTRIAPTPPYSGPVTSFR